MRTDGDLQRIPSAAAAVAAGVTTTGCRLCGGVRQLTEAGYIDAIQLCPLALLTAVRIAMLSPPAVAAVAAADDDDDRVLTADSDDDEVLQMLAYICWRGDGFMSQHVTVALKAHHILSTGWHARVVKT